MQDNLKIHSKLELPDTSAWERKSYDPVLWVYKKKDEWPSWIEKIFDLWFVPKTFLRDFFIFLQKLKVWIPVIWKDRDWDDSYIFEIIKTKLITQRKCLVENNRHTGISETNRDITICLNLIERFQQSYYEIEYFDYYENEIWFDEVEDIEEGGSINLFEMKSQTKRDDLLTYIEKYPLDKKRTIEKIEKLNIEPVNDYPENPESRQRLALYMSQYRHDKCKRLIFLILQQRIDRWWD